MKNIFYLIVIFFSCSVFADEPFSMTDEQKFEFKSQLLSDSSVMEIRSYIGRYLDGNLNGEDDYLTELNISREILESPFMVYWVDGFMAGGSVITIISQKEPSVFLDVWTYKIDDDLAEVRGVWITKVESEKKQRILSAYRLLISDLSLGI